MLKVEKSRASHTTLTYDLSLVIMLIVEIIVLVIQHSHTIYR